MESEFVIGDCVHLRSGSARQTVIAVQKAIVDGSMQVVMITTAWVSYESQQPHTLSAHPGAFILSQNQNPMA
jgi:uncharacterized protein YodC (DUF2158 family)